MNREKKPRRHRPTLAMLKQAGTVPLKRIEAKRQGRKWYWSRKVRQHCYPFRFPHDGCNYSLRRTANGVTFGAEQERRLASPSNRKTLSEYDSIRQIDPTKTGDIHK